MNGCVLLCLSFRMMSDWKVEMVEDHINEFYVEFKGPRESKISIFLVIAIPSQS